MNKWFDEGLQIGYLFIYWSPYVQFIYWLIDPWKVVDAVIQNVFLENLRTI